MLNNDILRRLRYTLNLSDNEMIAIFASANRAVSRQQISAWLKKEDAAGYEECMDRTMATFLNGLINEKRGKREGIQPNPENKLNNNLIFKKLRIAFNLKDDDILALLEDAGLRISKHELSAFFRAPEHRQSRQCKDQVLRNFLQGLQNKYRVESEAKEKTKPKPQVKKCIKTQPKQDEPRKNLSLGKPKFVWKEK
ncbi:YehS family protein [Ghiorsea bivora]|uniref:DUF1456 family protein n=1 Tax=Ghiorsea bivora TaxID=1485545 RepID=UPI0009DEAE8E|nr:DUF1456 family protein [Ghiorsea bivora]